MKMKKRTVDQKTSQSRRKRKKSPGREEKTMPSVVNMKKIWEYMKDKKTKIDNDMEDKERRTDDIMSSEDNRLKEDNLIDTRSQGDSVKVKTMPR